MDQASSKARMHDLNLFFSLSLYLLCVAATQGETQ